MSKHDAKLRLSQAKLIWNLGTAGLNHEKDLPWLAKNFDLVRSVFHGWHWVRCEPRDYPAHEDFDPSLAQSHDLLLALAAINPSKRFIKDFFTWGVFDYRIVTLIKQGKKVIDNRPLVVDTEKNVEGFPDPVKHQTRGVIRLRPGNLVLKPSGIWRCLRQTPSDKTTEAYPGQLKELERECAHVTDTLPCVNAAVGEAINENRLIPPAWFQNSLGCGGTHYDNGLETGRELYSLVEMCYFFDYKLDEGDDPLVDLAPKRWGDKKFEPSDFRLICYRE